MAKHASMSNCRFPNDHSKKNCVCGGHSQKDRKRQKRKPGRETIRRKSTDARQQEPT